MSSSLAAAQMSYAAAIVGFLTYGIYVPLAGMCLYFQLQHRKQTKGRYVLIVYTSAMFVVSTIYFCVAAKWSAIEFVDSTVDPAVFASQLSSRLSITKDTAAVINIWLADSLIIYRTYMIWEGNLCILAFPFLMYSGTIGVGLALLIETAKPGAAYGSPLISQLGTAFWSISVSLNVISTSLIAGQLLWHRRSLQQVGLHQGDKYIGITAILVESAGLYSICGLIYIPLFAQNLPLQYPFSALLNSVTSIAPNLIILRMALGIATKYPTGASTSDMSSTPESRHSGRKAFSNIFATRSRGGSTTFGSQMSSTPKSLHSLEV